MDGEDPFWNRSHTQHERLTKRDRGEKEREGKREYICMYIPF